MNVSANEIPFWVAMDDSDPGTIALLDMIGFLSLRGAQGGGMPSAIIPTSPQTSLRPWAS